MTFNGGAPGSGGMQIMPVDLRVGLGHVPGVAATVVMLTIGGTQIPFDPENAAAMGNAFLVSAQRARAENALRDVLRHLGEPDDRIVEVVAQLRSRMGADGDRPHPPTIHRPG